MLFKLYRKEDVAGGFFAVSEELPSALPPQGAWPGLNTQPNPSYTLRVCPDTSDSISACFRESSSFSW